MQAQTEMQRETAGPAEIQTTERRVHWRLGTRIAFRFVFAYFILYCLPFPLGWFHYTGYPAQKWNHLKEFVVPWVGKHVLHLSSSITIFPNGSGDTTYNYVEVLCFLAVAVFATAIWSLLDRRRPNYEKLQQWLILYIRLVLATTMISYGTAKVIQGQFPTPNLARLLQPYGDSSPMGLLWTFMGASRSYCIFTGAVEMLGGILLFVPRLTTLGALVCLGAMGNIFVLNMSYDVPVKLYSLNLLLMSLLLLAPDLRRMADFFVFNRRVESVVRPPLFKRKWMNGGILVFQLLMGVYGVSWDLYSAEKSSKAYGDDAPKPALYGIWVVDEFAVDGQVRPPLATDETRWNKVLFDWFDFSVMSVSGSRRRFRPQLDLEKKTLILAKREDPNSKSNFTIEKSDPVHITLEGQFDGHRIKAQAHQGEERKFLLLNRGFHWINEYPFNR
jgi:uncharacterized membrane protein YphA (DoxX/SURF4 family)